MSGRALPLAARPYGDHGPVLLILHGLFGSARNWHSIATRLGEQYRVYAVDLRNHGDSPWSGEMDYHAMADDLEALIERIDATTVHVLGHSMGGKAAMTLAQRGCEALDRLVVVDIAPVAYQHSHLDYIEAMQALDLNQFTQRRAIDQALAEQISPAGVRQFLLQNLVSRDGHFDWRINLPALASHMQDLVDYPSGLPPYAGPTLFLAGGNSHYIVSSMESTLQSAFPHHRLTFINGAGHWVHAERPDEVIHQVQHWIEA